MKGVLVDPSCSGSGTARAQLDQQLGGVDADRHQARLRRLADFQVRVSLHPGDVELCTVICPYTC